ncbi:MAG: sigma-70 family RNA polymerase sigma factor [Acidobacteria bacterium]|nr:sigma-70 family RNA polymerase sigma factor [Acidobacteriota bacterium]
MSGTSGKAGWHATVTPPGISPDDGELVERLLAGEEAAFAGLVNQYHGSLVRLARAFVASRDVAEEVAQETWLAVLTGLASFEGRSALKTWIFRILTNRAKTRGQRDKRLVSFSAGAGDQDDDAAVDRGRFAADGSWAQPPALWGEATPEALLLRHEALQVIEQAIAGLPPAQRAVVTLRDVEGLPSDDVCDVLEVSEVNQRVLLHRGRSKVRAAMERYLGAPHQNTQSDQPFID